jgi:hypothetical protein
LPGPVENRAAAGSNRLFLGDTGNIQDIGEAEQAKVPDSHRVL